MGDLVQLRPEPKAWEQQPGEGDAEFGYFSAWLMHQPRYNVAGYELARRFDWAQRAVSFDNVMSTAGKSTGQLLNGAFANIGRAVAREANTLLDRINDQPRGCNVLTPTELTKLMTLIAEHPELFAGTDQKADLDFSKFTELELRVMQAGHQLLKDVNNRSLAGSRDVTTFAAGRTSSISKRARRC